VLVAVLSLVRRFIILDLYQTTSSLIAALAGASLALGIVFWRVPAEFAAERSFFIHLDLIFRVSKLRKYTLNDAT
jgi:hypothetical protein